MRNNRGDLLQLLGIPKATFENPNLIFIMNFLNQWRKNYCVNKTIKHFKRLKQKPQLSSNMFKTLQLSAPIVIIFLCKWTVPII